MRGHSEQVEPAERKRRTAAVRKGEAIARRLGFVQFPDRVGWWCHDDLVSSLVFPLTVEHRPVQSAADVIDIVYFSGVTRGSEEARTQIRHALGL